MQEMILKFIINGQTLTRIDTEKPVENSRGYLKAHFALPTEYSGTISAYFKYNNGTEWVGTPMTVDKLTGLCDVPSDCIVAGNLYVALQSADTDIDIPTNAVKVYIDHSGVPKSLLPSPDGTPNEYQDFVLKHTEVVEKTAIAVDSAAAAELSEANAYNSELNAKASETAAKTSEDNAMTSETNAASSASTATSKADIATTKANEASTSATNAATSATNAASSASTATAKANEASASATNAATSATNAATTAAEAITARNSTIKNKIFDSLDLRLEDIEYGSDTAIVDTKTGTSIQSTVADDYIAELKIEGATTVTKANPDLDISPDNVATIVSASNFEVVACGKNLAYNATYLATSQFGTSVKSESAAMLPSTTFTVSLLIPNGERYYANESLFTTYPSITGDGTRKSITLTTKSEVSKSNTSQYSASGWIIFKNTSGYSSSGTASGLQIEFGTVTTVAYETYKESNKLTITQELRKLLSGVADIKEKGTNGKWYDNYKINKVVFDGSADEIWGKNSTSVEGRYRFTISAPDKKASGLADSLLCNILNPTVYTVSSPKATPSISGHTTANTLNVYGTMFDGMSITQFKAWLALNPVTVYYELETPVVIEVTDAKLATYKGTTNIYSTATVQPTLTATFKSRLANSYSLIMAEITKIKQAIIALGGTV